MRCVAKMRQIVLEIRCLSEPFSGLCSARANRELPRGRALLFLLHICQERVSSAFVAEHLSNISICGSFRSSI
jgi:hypothetical protein